MFRLSKADFRRLYADATVVEADGERLKVLRFSNGDFLKLFHRRRLLSSALFHPYSRRFAKNAKRIRAAGVPTVVVQTLFRIPHLRCTAVRYTPLPGSTLRELADYVDTGIAAQYGRFLAELHYRGIVFPAVHPGNVVRMTNGEFGLIDIAQLRCHRFPLTQRLRGKNLTQIARSRLDEDFLRQFGQAVLSGYEAVAGSCPIDEFPLPARHPAELTWAA